MYKINIRREASALSGYDLIAALQEPYNDPEHLNHVCWREETSNTEWMGAPEDQTWAPLIYSITYRQFTATSWHLPHQETKTILTSVPMCPPAGDTRTTDINGGTKKRFGKKVIQLQKRRSVQLPQFNICGTKSVTILYRHRSIHLWYPSFWM